MGINLYEIDFRMYDPAIGRFNRIDPVTQFSQGTSVAFDNNLVFWADPSGADGTGMVPLSYQNFMETGNCSGVGFGGYNTSGVPLGGGSNPQGGESVMAQLNRPNQPTENFNNQNNGQQGTSTVDGPCPKCPNKVLHDFIMNITTPLDASLDNNWDYGPAIELAPVIINVTKSNTNNKSFDFSGAATGILGASVINASFESQLNYSFSGSTIPKEIKYLKGASRYGGGVLNVASISLDINQYANNEISAGKLGYRITGTGTSIWAAVAAKGGFAGLVVGGVFSLGESFYDANKVSSRLRKESSENSRYKVEGSPFKKSFWTNAGRYLNFNSFYSGFSY